MDDGNDPKRTARVIPAAAEMSNLENALQLLAESLTHLQERLEPTLSPDSGRAAEEPDKMPEEQFSPLVLYLKGCSTKVHRQVARINELGERLEI
jgi:hypothetical protein